MKSNNVDRKPDATLVFFDTEFTELGMNPRLISIGLVSEDGDRTFYAELADTYRLSDCSDFVKEAVLPHLEGGEARMDMYELAFRLGNWLESFEQSIQLATDSLSWDWPWIQEMLRLPGTWPENLVNKPLVLSQSPAFILSVEDAFKSGLRRHHSLDDAKANRLGRLAQEKEIKAAWWDRG